jgi:hypothetical protein
VRPFLVELFEEAIKADLLLEAVHLGWPCGLFLEGSVHALLGVRA